jgi:uncharacterized protein
MNILWYIAAGLGVGVASGMLGIGGGVLLVPLLIWVFHFDHHKALGTTLAIMVPPVGLLAAWEYYRRDAVDLPAAVFIAASFVVGAYLGAKLVFSPYIPVSLLRLLFGMMLIYIGGRFLLASNKDVASAFIGLVAVGLAWLAYIGLWALGRHHLRPNLGDKIRELEQPEKPSGDYYI